MIKVPAPIEITWREERVGGWRWRMSLEKCKNCGCVSEGSYRCLRGNKRFDSLVQKGGLGFREGYIVSALNSRV